MNSAASDPVLIGVDWGTSSFRAFLIGAEGVVLQRIEAPLGILHVEGRDFDGAMARLLQPWLTAAPLPLPIIVSGMITSRNGWVETPYIAVPGGAVDLARALVPHRTQDGTLLHFVTGMTVEHQGLPDVMRGEETQIVGAAADGRDSGVFVMPGTHSKWVTVRDGLLDSYATFMTGEVFAALKSHTILGALMKDAPFSASALVKGAQRAQQTGTELLHSLFSVRTLPLFGLVCEEETADYLSGLLIGAEVQGAASYRDGSGPVTIVGRTDLADRYEAVLQVFDIASVRAAADVVARGHYEIARVGGLMA